MKDGMVGKELGIGGGRVEERLVGMEDGWVMSERGWGFLEDLVEDLGVRIGGDGVGEDLWVEEVEDWGEVE
ncbi:hypothetical protein, partial [Neisseria sicca]|uniref:hypothetical protein n=1 Tax=Neisseria sicca TaxID=490 RepID=UPI001C99733C